MIRYTARFSALMLVTACSMEAGQGVEDATEIPYAEGSQEALAIVAVANDRDLGVAQFDADDMVGLSSQAAKNIVAHRDGADAASTDDDNLYDNLAELWGVSYCKRTCVDKILAYAKKTGVYGSGDAKAYVIFSPQAMGSSHLAEAAKLIDEADETIDIAMYSYSHSDPVKGALQRALDRGVKIRFLADTDLAVDASKAGGLESMGIDVRRVTKIMHHKFAIIDGPRTEQTHDRAKTASLITGSGNWSSSAATQYDENTLFLKGYPELALRMQRDFDVLWGGSKDQVYNASLTWDQTRANITDAIIADQENENVDVFFTSANFKAVSGGGWTYLGTNVVTDQLVKGIQSAETSIEIASGHFVSTPIAQAVADALADNPSLKVTIALDCQETGRDGVIADLKADIEERGGSIYYKCNTYRWHYKFAKQMHHKYMVIDGEVLYTGSLNFSDNAETNTFENMFLFKGSEHAAMIKAYQDNLANVREYGREDNLAALEDLKDQIANSDVVPLVFPVAMSIDLPTFNEVRDLIRTECPATQTWTGTGEAKTYNQWFNQFPEWFDECHKTGYPWPDVPLDKRIP
ncbi:MAG TPA: phospholipase D-like domain-containing protein [Polyangiaceae bacterium]|nr:phospholipase D-like domain-containing protein [Polyangiaceae bacterium]